MNVPTTLSDTIAPTAQPKPDSQGTAGVAAASTGTYPRLTPLLAPWVPDLLTDQTALQRLFAQHGSPINVHNTQPFLENYREYKAVLEQYNLRHQIFFARKANKCRAFVQAAEQAGFGVDTASYRELKQALALGNQPERLVLTAAIKEERLIRLAVEHDVLIVVDNEDECHLINRVADELQKSALVGVRVSGFVHDGELLYSRFGFALNAAVRLISERMGPGQEFARLHFRGLHFHLNGYSRQQRGAALLATIHCADALRERGITTHFIDIGGGFLVRYLAEQQEWEHFHRELARAVRGERPPVTFRNNGLGLELIEGELHGKPTVYPYYNETPRATFLTEILDYQDEQGQAVATLLREREIKLRMEPGRSLLDQAGVTLARVAFRKWDSNGDLLVGLEMNRTQMFSSSADFLLDPLVLHQQPDPTATPTAAYFVGAYCLEQDLLLKRKINLAQVPAVGDIVCFPNTAGYMMHFFESEAHLFELATNLVMVHEPDGELQPHFIDDESL